MQDSVLTCLVFIIFGVVLLPFVLMISNARKIKALQSSMQKLSQRLAALELHTSEHAAAHPDATASPLTTVSAPVPSAPVPAASVAAVSPAVAAILGELPSRVETPEPPSPAPAKARPHVPIEWEAFMGVKLFSWVGGFALFLGVVFLVKYSFENNLITPAMRIVIGAVIGSGLIAAGWFTARRNYRVPGQSLCATGVLVLYADIFGAHAFYNLLSLAAAFVLMSIVTVVAFLLAVRLDAQVVVVLGLIGGFLTPPLLTTGQENPFRLFGYVALLNAGIAAVGLRKRWDYLFALAAAGTILTQWAWAFDFTVARANAGFLIFLLLEAQFLAFQYLRRKLPPPENWSTYAALAIGFSALAFAFCFVSYAELAARPAFLFSFTFLADIGLLALATTRANPSRIAGPAGAVVFALLAAWTSQYLTHPLLWWGLGGYIVFALIHSGFSVWPSRAETKPGRAQWQGLVPLLALVLLFICVWNGETSFAVWTCVLLIDAIAVATAWSARSVLALLVALIATLITAGLWIFTAPPVEEGIVGILTVVGGFGIFFSVAASLLMRRVANGVGDTRRNVPALAAAMPFILLMMVVAKLPVPEPSAVFGVAMLMTVVLLALGILARTSWIAAVGLAFTWVLEREWHTLHFSSAHAVLPLAWYIVFGLLFVAFPFFAREERSPIAWAVGAVSGLLHFLLTYEVVAASYPAFRNGLLPALFALPFICGVYYLIRKRGVVPSSGDARLAWQGGAALLFVSLIFPIQFQREWITLGWAVEGLALLALFRLVPNAGLRLAGAALLSVAFVRLALNPAVFEYHPRAGTRIWNWYLCAYGITSICLFLGARLVHQSRETQLVRVIPRLLYTLGAILAFLLLNIEIADYFSIGPTLTFAFSGNFARDMTYSIAWALFAFALLLVGMKRQLRYVRYAALALLIVTLVKLFLHDLGNLSQLYRIGAFIGVALILIVASFVYQRFLAPEAESGKS
ncbi:MAG: DUF2339 domain-containing protein [Chthoniobacterales bacterium]|nr:DUF2339 domain-containing protein [Chthoniobacterales bacterium]